MSSDRSSRARSPRTASRPARIALAVVLVLAATWGAWLGWQRLVTPRPAPEVTFGSIDGQRIELASLRGQVVMIEFWATSCVICVREMPDIVALAEELAPQGLTTIAVAMPYDRPDHVLAYASRHRLPFIVALDPLGEVLDAFGPIPGTPTRFIVSRDGHLAATQIGAADIRRLRAQLRDQLARPAG